MTEDRVREIIAEEIAARFRVTRLAPSSTAQEAARLYKAMLDK